MSDFDGSAFEMPEHSPVEDGAIEALLMGTSDSDDLDSLLSSFVARVRVAVEAVPPPSPAMAAVLAVGFSTEKGDLSATAASNVNGPASQEAGLSKWRKAKMKTQGFLAGLGVAGKIALGIGVAAAATTSAGAAGMLPFSMPGTGHSPHHRVVAPPITSTTRPPTNHSGTVRSHGTGTGGHPSATVTPTTGTVATSTTTFVAAPPAPTTVPTTPTTSTPPTTYTTPTTAYLAPTTTTYTTPTTQPSTASMQLSCAVTGGTQVTCTWTEAPTPVAQYALWRWKTGGDGSDYAPVYQTANGLTFTDNGVAAGTPYTYRVFTTLGDASPGAVSNRFYITCCS
jgi:hypothetical protein